MTTRAGRAAPELAPLDTASGEDFLLRLGEAAESAAAATGGWQDHDRAIPGGVKLRCAGTLFPGTVLPAFAHLDTTAKPELSVHLWDRASTATAMPAPPWSVGDYGAHGAIRGFFGNGRYAVYQWGSHVLTVLDAPAATAHVWADGLLEPPVFERAAPLRTLLHLWLDGRGCQLVHAGAVGTRDGVALLVGNAGVGKSSLGLACLSHGLAHLADDYCVLEPGEPITARSVYSTAKANVDTVERLGLGALVANPERPPGEKALLFLGEHRPHALVRAAPVRLILIPRVGDRLETRSAPATPAEAMRALAPSTLLQLPGTGRRTLDRLSAVAAGVPAHHLEVGTDSPGAAETVRRLLGNAR